MSTTADCWSCHNKSYLGMTVHWINPTTRAREHAVLVCRRLKGSHTFDVLAEVMTEVHSKFSLQDKVTRTTTDNGSNFVKAFVQFGKKPDLLPTPDFQEEDIVDSDLLEEGLPEMIEETEPEEFIPVQEVLEQNDDISILPKHMRCAAHTMNLVASADADKALDDDQFSGACTSAMTKAKQLWNCQSRSTVHADAIQEELKRRLVVPNATRWNSTYNSVQVLNELLDLNR